MQTILKSISTKEAESIILNSAISYGIETVSLIESVGRVLAEDVFADRDFPPFNRVCMDGICIKRKDFESGIKQFKIIGVQGAGDPVSHTLSNGDALEIMTGAILPDSADCVIRYEDLKIEDGLALILTSELPKNNSIHTKGVDRSQDDLILPKNSLIEGAHISLLATVGKARVQVYKRPKIAVLSTGNELVELHINPEPHQIRRSNAYAIESIIKKYASSIKQLHIPDSFSNIKDQLSELLDDYDIVVLSGGVSKGKFDFIPEVLDELGAVVEFHGVQQRPGKPFWYGKRNQCRIFALPGNPMSSLTCCHRYVIPYLRKSLGMNPLKIQYAILQEEIVFKPNLTRFIEANIISHENGQLIAQPIFGNGSGDFTKMIKANAFLELSAKISQFNQGDVVPFFQINA